jgi:4-amino-4-deoxy-L-arabinose transferase-like glycosyltransferase
MTSAEKRLTPERSRVTTLLLSLVLALAAFIQLTVVSRTVVDQPLRADAGEYFSYAWNLYYKGTYSSARPADDLTSPVPDKVRTPGYPIFLIAVGPPEATEAFLRKVSYFQALLGIGSVFLIFQIASSFLRSGWALVPALLTATSPHFVMLSTYVLSESLFCFLLLASVFASIRALEVKHLTAFALAGILWGLCALVRPTMQFFPAAVLVLALLLPQVRSLRKPIAIMCLTFMAVMAPWLIRNSTTEQSGPSLMLNNIAHGAYPGFMYDERPETFGFPYRFDPEYPEHVKNGSHLLTHLKERFSSEPLKYATWFLAGKPYFFLSLRDAQAYDIQIYPTPKNPYYERPFFAWMRGLSIQVHWPLMLAGIAGIALLAVKPRIAAGRTESAWLCATAVALVVLYAIGLHMVAAPFPRYAIPFRPLIYALAMIPLLGAWRGIRELHASRAAEAPPLQ